MTESYLPLPAQLLYSKPLESRLLDLDRTTGKSKIGQFQSFASLLNRNDLLVFNNSALVRASLPVFIPSLGIYGKMHIGTSLSDNGKRIVEMRPKRLNETLSENSGIIISGTSERVILRERHSTFRRFFWAETESGKDLLDISERSGSYIRYDHIPFDIPDSYYETEFARIKGSVEFPSAARPFNSELIGEIEEICAGTAEITLHCNLGSLEPPEFMENGILLDEKYEIPVDTVEKIEETKNAGGRVIAIGTSVVRALESASLNEMVRSGQGKTELFIDSDYRFKAVDAILTGLHESEGSHISMISSFAGNENLIKAYYMAQKNNLFWHEFGDLAFIH